MGNNNEQYLEYLEDYRNRENIESTYSNDPLKEESIDFEALANVRSEIVLSLRSSVSSRSKSKSCFRLLLSI